MTDATSATETQEAPQQEDSLPERLEQGYHALEERAFDAKQQLEKLNEQALDLIQEKPLAAIGIAFVGGYLLGAMASRRWIV